MTTRFRLALALCGVLALTIGVSSAFAAKGGNSANAKLCQKDGWQSLFTSTGLPFSSEDACVAYAAQGGKLSTTGCSVTATSGCLTLTNVVFPSFAGDGSTVTLNGAWSFTTTCNNADPSNHCDGTQPNDLASGSGSYVIKDSGGAVLEQGTITTADTAGSLFEGLALAAFLDGSGNPTSCSSAVVREVGVYGSTGNSADPYVLLAVSSGDANLENFFETSSGGAFGGPPPTGITITC